MSLFDSARAGFLTAAFDLLADTYRVALVSTISSSYTNLSDIPPSNILATSGPLTGAALVDTAAGRVAFDLDDVTFAALSGSTTIQYIVIYKDTGTSSTSRLLDYRSFTFTPLGVDMTVQWDSGTSRVFALYATGSTNEFYTKTRKKFMQGAISMVADTIKAALVSSAYTFDRDADEFLDDLPGGSILAEATLTAKVVSASGVFTASNLLIPDLASGDIVTQVILYKDTGSAATSPLIGRIGQADYGLPYTGDGEPMAVGWSSSGILRF